MTSEELAVVQAAMELRYKILANPEALRPLHNANNALTPALSELSRVTYLLAVACPQCNAGGHTCPGDGNHIPHGATDCGEHDETAEANHEPTAFSMAADVCVCSREKPMYCAASNCHGGADICDNCAPLLAGASSTRVDGTEASSMCTTCGTPAEAELLNWVPRTWADVRTGDRLRMLGTDMTARVQSAVHLHWYVKPGTGTSLYNPPELLEYSGVRVVLQRAGFASTDPYEMDPAKPVEIELSDAEVIALDALGWHNRVGLVIEVQDVTS